jgi:Mrp family chromosome partitioning ATPase
MADAPRSADAEAFRFTAGSIQRIRAARGKSLTLAFVSAAAGPARSAVVANLALALAESGTRVLAVDADPSGDLTALLLPDTPDVDGLEQVLAGRRAAADCIVPSPFRTRLAVLGSGATTGQTMTGTAYFRAMRRVLVEAKAGYELVLVDSPALLQVAVASDLVDASDGVVVVMGPREPIRDHLDVLKRLDLLGAEVIGYVHARAPLRPRRRRHLRLRPPSGSLRRRRAPLSRFRPAAAAAFERVPALEDEGHPSPAHGSRR